MKVVYEAPTLRSRRLIVTEHGISYGGRPLGERSAHSNREGQSHRGGWENHPQGKGAQVVRRTGAMRSAKCGEP
jgi:hypothetical protein